MRCPGQLERTSSNPGNCWHTHTHRTRQSTYLKVCILKRSRTYFFIMLNFIFLKLNFMTYIIYIHKNVVPNTSLVAKFEAKLKINIPITCLNYRWSKKFEQNLIINISCKKESTFESDILMQYKYVFDFSIGNRDLSRAFPFFLTICTILCLVHPPIIYMHIIIF